MKVQDAGRACPLMEIVYVLGYDIHVIVFLQGCYGKMGGVGLCVFELSPAVIVEIKHQPGVPEPSLM